MTTDEPELPDDDAADVQSDPPVPPEQVVAEIATGRMPDAVSLRSLADASEAVVVSFVELWPRLEPERRRELLATLQQLSEDEATLDFHHIHVSALRDADPATRILAIRGLWEQEREQYMRLLTAQLHDDPEATVRAACAEALGQFAVSMEFGLLTEDGEDALGGALRDSVEDVTENDEVRGSALESLGASSEEWVVELITEQYDSASARMRLAALRAMGRNASDGWLQVLIHHFDDDQSDMRAAAAASAGQLLIEDAIDPLTALVDDDDEEVQVAAISALGEIAGDGAEQVLTNLLERGAPHVREAAQLALAAARLNGADFTLMDDTEDEDGA